MLTIIALVAAALFVPSPWSVWLVVGAACVDLAETAVMVAWSRRRRASGPPAVGTEAIVGRTGVTLARLDADRRGARGQVRVDGEIWRARAIEPVDRRCDGRRPLRRRARARGRAARASFLNAC